MDSPITSGIEQVAGRGVGLLAGLASIKGGGLLNYMMQRERMLNDPGFRASLVDSPFTSGFFGIGGGSAPSGAAAPAQPVAQPEDFVGPTGPQGQTYAAPAPGGITAPGDVRYLPTGGHWYPDLPPLDYASQVKAEQDRSTMIGLTSSDPAIRTQSKLAIGVPLTNEELTQSIGAGRGMVTMAGPGSQVRYKLPGGDITVGSPYISGNYLDPNAAAVVAARTGKVVVPSPSGGYEAVEPERPTEGEYTNAADAAKNRQPGEVTKLTGRTVNGVPTYYNVRQEPAGVAPLPAGPTQPAAKPARPAAAPAQPRATAAPSPPPPPPPPESQAAPSPAPETPPAAAAPAPPPPPPPHEVVRQNPDGSFSPVKPPPPPPPRAPRAEATPATAPPYLAAAGPPLFQFPGAGAPIAQPGPVMLARAEPPPYEVVPGAELGGIASGAPPAPRQAAAPLPVVPATAVPWTPAQPGQPTAGAPGAPPAAPVGTQTFTETQPIAPEKGGGSITYSGETPAKLDLERRRLEIQKDVDARFGDIPESKDLSHAYLVRSLANDLINQYTPEERAGYLGYVTPFLRGIFSSNDPRYAHFLDLNARLQQETGGEKSLAPSGNERTPAEYDAALRGTVDTTDKMISAQIGLASMRRLDLTPTQQQKFITDRMSGPSTVHYGPYPWGDESEETQSTPKSSTPPPTSPYVVDRLYHVQPAR